MVRTAAWLATLLVITVTPLLVAFADTGSQTTVGASRGKPRRTPTPTATATSTVIPTATPTVAPTLTPTATTVPPSTPTPIPTATPSPVVEAIIAAAGDIACDPGSSSYNGGLGTATGCHSKYTSDLLVDMGLTALLTLGDNQYEDGALWKFQQSYDPTWGRLKSITRPSVGNHEYGTPSASGYFSYFGAVAGDPNKGYYSYNIGSWRLIALNSNCSQVGGCQTGSPQEQWLRADLAASPALCTLAYWHHPRFSSGPHGSDVSFSALWQALYDANADLVLTGHDHDYERFAPQDPSGGLDLARGIREFVVGTGGKNHYGFSNTIQPNSEARNSDTFGVLKLTLRSAGYDWQFVPESGKSFTDSGSASCH